MNKENSIYSYVVILKAYESDDKRQIGCSLSRLAFVKDKKLLSQISYHHILA